MLDGNNLQVKRLLKYCYSQTPELSTSLILSKIGQSSNSIFSSLNSSQFLNAIFSYIIKWVPPQWEGNDVLGA